MGERYDFFLLTQKAYKLRYISLFLSAFKF